MAQKPVIAYIESSHSGMSDDNHYRDALSFFLRQHLGCEVIVYDYDRDFEEDIARIEKFSKGGQLIVVIVKQQEYDDQHTRIIKKVRDDLSKSLPIVVIPDWRGEERFNGLPDDPLVYTHAHSSPELVELINNLIAAWKPGLNWLGAQTTEDQAILMAQLENAYRKHYLDDEDDGMLGTPDRNHQIVAEALRLKLLPSICLKAEFDDTIERKTRVFVTAEPSVYQKEVEKIKAMTDDERKEFDHSLDRARGHMPAEGGGVYVTRASCGENVNGFAIDPVTLETYVTRRFGEHHMAKDMLAHRVEVIEELKKGRNGSAPEDEDAEYRVKWRIMAGLIFSEIDGFTTPILRLYKEHGDNEEDSKKVVAFLLREQRFIPVDFDGKLMEC